MAKKISSAQNANAPLSSRCMLGLLLPQASQSCEKSEQSTKAAERKPNPSGPACSTSVEKSGRTTLKLMPNSEITPTTAIINNTDGVCATYPRPSRKLCNVLCFAVSCFKAECLACA